MRHLKRLEIQGGPRDRGLQYGVGAVTEIAATIQAYTSWFRDFAGLEWEQVVEASAAYLDFFERHGPDVVEEMRGVAEGSGRELDEVVALNARTEIAYTRVASRPQECTSLVVTGERSDDGHVYIAENWDWLPAVLPHTVLLHVRQPDGLEIATITEAGMLAKFGVNSAGIGLCNNLLATDVNHVGATFHSLARKALSADSLLAALWSVTSAARGGAGHFLLGAAVGEAAGIEWAPGDFNILYPREGFLAHANHFVTELPGRRDRTKFVPSVSPGTYLRHERVLDLLRKASGTGRGVSVEDIQGILRDHRHWPEGICRHSPVDTRTEHQILVQTNVSFIVDLTARRMYHTVGPPCDQEYVAEALPWAEHEEQPLLRGVSGVLARSDRDRPS